MAGSDPLERLRAELAGDGPIPAFSVREGRVQQVNAAARAVFATLRVGAEVGELFDQRIVALHRGRIWVDASPGGGAVFGFGIPAARAAGG